MDRCPSSRWLTCPSRRQDCICAGVWARATDPVPPAIHEVHDLGTAAQGSGPLPGPLGLFACVVDEHPRFHLDALRWFATLTAVAGVDPTELVVHVVGPESSDALDYLKSQGVAIRTVDRFDHRSPHCNKISGALRL